MADRGSLCLVTDGDGNPGGERNGLGLAPASSPDQTPPVAPTDDPSGQVGGTVFPNPGPPPPRAGGLPTTRSFPIDLGDGVVNDSYEDV